MARLAFGLARQLRICARLLAEWWQALSLGKLYSEFVAGSLLS